MDPLTQPTRLASLAPQLYLTMTRTLCSLLLALSSITVSASTIEWGGSYEDQLFTSTGAALDGTFRFELGTFTAGFNPNDTNRSSWATNWKVFDAAVNGDGWTPATGYLTSSATLLSNLTSDSPYATGNLFTPGDKMYLWAYNTLSIAPGTEWALISGTHNTTGSASDSNWILPNPTGQDGNVLQWRFTTADSAILGGVEGERGPGHYSYTPPSYNLQTSNIPEPSSMLLLLSSASLLTLRRKRQKG
jgi:hypothetical protein